MAITLGVADPNKLWPSGWTTGTGGMAVSGYPTFNANGDANEQNRYVGTDPWGNSAMVWQCTSTGGNDASGGWNTDSFAIDLNKLYRFSVWVRRTSSTSGGTFYFGTQSSTGAVTSLGSQGSEGNPYFDYRGTGSLSQNQWYLVTGHVFPQGWPARIAHPESGFYTTTGGRVANNGGNIPNDACWQGGTTTTYHRCYHYYCADTTTRIEFYDPRVDCCDGTEPSIQRLLAGPMGTQGGHGVILHDGSKVVSGNTGDAGDLVDVQTFGATGTWTKPAGTTKVLVKVIGGGGGGAGYCESGGAGGYSEGYFDVTGVSTVSVTVGGGGGGVGYYAAAGGGGTSSFGSFISATGGGGANSYSSHSGGHGGTGSGGYVNVQGGGGAGHTNSVSTWSGGRGGYGYFGGGGTTARNHFNLGNTPLKTRPGAPGAGGPGGQTDGHSYYGDRGATGEIGMVVVYSYK
jgi:hypothetical protein